MDLLLELEFLEVMIITLMDLVVVMLLFIKTLMIIGSRQEIIFMQVFQKLSRNQDFLSIYPQMAMSLRQVLQVAVLFASIKTLMIIGNRLEIIYMGKLYLMGIHAGKGIIIRMDMKRQVIQLVFQLMELSLLLEIFIMMEKEKTFLALRKKVTNVFR